MKKILLLLLIGCSLAVACQKGTLEADPSQPVRGLITGVDQDRIQVTDEQGKSWQFSLPPEIGVPLDHLKEHQDQKWPVSVTFVNENGVRKATKIAD